MALLDTVFDMAAEMTGVRVRCFAASRTIRREAQREAIDLAKASNVAIPDWLFRSLSHDLHGRPGAPN